MRGRITSVDVAGEQERQFYERFVDPVYSQEDEEEVQRKKNADTVEFNKKVTNMSPG